MTDIEEKTSSPEKEVKDVQASGDGDKSEKLSDEQKPSNGTDVGGGDNISSEQTNVLNEAKVEKVEEDKGGKEKAGKNGSNSDNGDKIENTIDSPEEKSKGTLFGSPVVIEGKRNRKKTARLSDAIHHEAIEKEKEVQKQNTDIPVGVGVKLGTIPYINHYLTHKMKNEDLSLLHRICFNVVGIKHSRRIHLKNFCGFEFEEGSKGYENKMEFVSRIFLDELKRVVLNPLGLKKGKNKEENTKTVMNFLMNPQDLNVPIPKTLKQKQAEKAAKKAKSGKKTKPSSSKSKKENETEEDSDEDVSDDDGDDEEEEPPKKVKKTNNKTEGKKPAPKKKENAESKKPKATPKKKAQKTKAEKPTEENESSSDSDSDSEPLVKKSKPGEPPTDDEIKDVVKRILDSSDLEDLSIRKVFQQVSNMYPEFDLSDKQKFIKKTVKEEVLMRS